MSSHQVTVAKMVCPNCGSDNVALQYKVVATHTLLGQNIDPGAMGIDYAYMVRQQVSYGPALEETSEIVCQSCGLCLDEDEETASEWGTDEHIDVKVVDSALDQLAETL